MCLSIWQTVQVPWLPRSALVQGYELYYKTVLFHLFKHLNDNTVNTFCERLAKGEYPFTHIYIIVTSHLEWVFGHLEQ